MLKEILFWEFKLIKFNNKMISTCKIQMFHVYSDASNTKIACVFKGKNKENVHSFQEEEDRLKFDMVDKRSHPIFQSSSIKHFENECIFSYMKSFTCEQITKKKAKKS